MLLTSEDLPPLPPLISIEDFKNQWYQLQGKNIRLQGYPRRAGLAFYGEDVHVVTGASFTPSELPGNVQLGSEALNVLYNLYPVPNPTQEELIQYNLNVRYYERNFNPLNVSYALYKENLPQQTTTKRKGISTTYQGKSFNISPNNKIEITGKVTLGGIIEAAKVKILPPERK